MSIPGIQFIRARKNLSSRGILVVVAMLLSACAITILVANGSVRTALMLSLVVPLVALAAINIRVAILAVIIYLVFMGDLRRLLIPFIGWSGEDPLLLIGAAFSILLCSFAIVSRSVKLDTPLARWTFALIVVMVLQIFNPAQGGLMVGMAGALFYVIPLMWFWIGRTYATEEFMRTLFYSVIIPLALVSAAMGYYQSFYGYMPYQETWYDLTGYTALGAKGKEAPISFFASSTEYGNFVIIAAALMWVVVLLRKSPSALIVILVLLVAVVLTGSRGPVVKVIATGAVLWAVLAQSKTMWISRGVLALILGAMGLTWSLAKVSDISANERIQHRVGRQAEGLLNPLEEKSSAVGHFNMMVLGYKRSAQEPLGLGLGATTKAAARFGGEKVSMEVDGADLAMSTGIVGGVIYHVMIFLIIVSSIRYWIRTRSIVAMGIMGILAVTFLLWLKGGQYAVSTIVWISVGALDRFQNLRPADTCGADGESIRA